MPKSWLAAHVAPSTAFGMQNSSTPRQLNAGSAAPLAKADESRSRSVASAELPVPAPKRTVGRSPLPIREGEQNRVDMSVARDGGNRTQPARITRVLSDLISYRNGGKGCAQSLKRSSEL
jgi:hypothetical protein